MPAASAQKLANTDVLAAAAEEESDSVPSFIPWDKLEGIQKSCSESRV